MSWTPGQTGRPGAEVWLGGNPWPVVLGLVPIPALLLPIFVIPSKKVT